MLALLVAVSVVSWALIAMKSVQLNRARAQSVSFLDTFWKALAARRHLPVGAEARRARPSPKVFRAGYEELSKLAQSKDGDEGAMSERLGGIENVERALQPRHHRASSPSSSRGSASWARSGATAPFVGLFGTVMGISRRLQRDRREGQRHPRHGRRADRQRAARHRRRPVRRHSRGGGLQLVRRAHPGLRHRDGQLLVGLPQHREAALLQVDGHDPWRCAAARAAAGAPR